ncbi:unnamed protein product [Scytosiphon promiscuus]
MQSHLVSRRRSEVAVAPLRPLALSRATPEILPYRGTLFLKVIKGTQLVQAPKLPAQKESKLARLSAFLADGKAGAGVMMHAVSVTSWLTEAEPEAQTPGGYGGSEFKVRQGSGSMAGESNTGSMSSFSRDDGLDNLGGRSTSESSLAGAGAADKEEAMQGQGGAGGAARAGEGGGGFRRTPKPDAARTSPKFISHGDPEGGASWDEEFFFGRVSGDIAVRIVCVDKGAEDEVVGELLIPVSRLPQNEPVEQWYGLEPAVAGGRRPSALGAMAGKDGLPVPGVGGGGGGASGMGAVGKEAVARHRGSGQAGLGATSEGFRQALLMAGVAPSGVNGGGGDGGGGAGENAKRRGVLRSESGAGREGREDYAVDASIDPFGADEMEDDGPAGRGSGARGEASDAYAQKGEAGMLGTQAPLQLGNWASTSAGTVHTGATAAEAALALSTDEILPAGLVDYFLVVGPASNEEGKLRVADYADCGFGSSGATRTADRNDTGEGELPATSVEVESAVLEHFPEEQREDAPFPTKVEWFCFPQGLFLRSSASQPAPHVSSFVRFTSGVRSYGLCLTFYRRVDVLKETTLFAATGSASRGWGESDLGSSGGGSRRSAPRPRRQERLWCPICLCVLTHIPVLEGLMHWLRMFHWCLVRLEKDSGGRKRVSRQPTELDAAVFQLTLEVPLPVPGVCAMSVKAFGERFWPCPEPEFALPGIRELPALSFPLGLLLRSLRPKGVLELFAAILQEGRILLHSTKPALLAAVAEGVFALMYPLQWPYAYVPVLPNCLIEHVESPQPFILGVHTDWLSDIAPDALEELIIVDCDLGHVKASGMEQLPPPVRRSLTKAVRAVLHSNLGNLDAPVRLSKPEPPAAAGAARGREEGGVGATQGTSARRGAPLASLHQRAPPASLIGSDRTFAGVGLSAWADRARTHQMSTAAAAAAKTRANGEGAAGQGGGEKSAEAGDLSTKGERRGAAGAGGGGGGDGQVVVPRARRERTRGAGARLEALLRLEFARAMADMLYGFTECLFFLHPDRPIFNGARFLQEYCEESYVPFMSTVIDTLAFKYLLETQHTPPFRLFHDMLDRARRDALRKGGDQRKSQMAVATKGPYEPSSGGAFDGPFPVLNGETWKRKAGVYAAVDCATQRGCLVLIHSSWLPKEQTILRAPCSSQACSHPSGTRHVNTANFARAGFDELVVSRPKSFDAARDSNLAGGASDGDDVAGIEEEHAAAEAIEHESLPDSPPPPPPTTRTASLSASSSRHSLGPQVAGGKDEGELKTGQASAQGTSTGVKARAKRGEERSGVRLSDARGGFISGGSVPRRASSVEEADEIPGEGDEEEAKAGGRRRGSGASSFGYGDLAPEVEGACYDSAGDWASDGSDGLPASAGESALEEEHAGSSELTVGQGTAPPRTETPLPTSSLLSSTSPGRIERRGENQDGAGEDPPHPPPSAAGGMSPGRNRVTMFSGRSGQPGRHESGDASGDAETLPPGRPSLALHVSTDTAVDDDDASSQLAGLSPRRKSPVRSQVDDGDLPPSPHGAAGLSKEQEPPSLVGSSGGPEADPEGAPRGTTDRTKTTEGSSTAEALGAAALVEEGPSVRDGGAPPPPSFQLYRFGLRHCGRRESVESYDDCYDPVVAPLSMVDWSHKPVLRLRECDLPQPREWTLADIGKEVKYTEISSHFVAGELDRDSEKLLQCLEAVYSSDRVSEEVVMNVEETLRTKPSVQKMFLQVLRHASRRGYANSRGPTLLHGPSFETLARFSYTLLCVCVDRLDYSVAHTLLQLTGNYFQVHEGGGDVFRGERTGSGVEGPGADGAADGGEPGYFSEFLSAGISRHPIFTDMRFWQHVLSEAVQAKTEKIAKSRHSMARDGGAGGEHASKDNGGVGLFSFPASPDQAADGSSNLPRKAREREVNHALEFKDPALASEIVCRQQVKVFLYEMASIGMRARTAQRYVEAVSLQYKLQAPARNRLLETVRLVWGAVASMAGPGSPPFGSELTPEMSVAQADWSQARRDAAADADIGIPTGAGATFAPGPPAMRTGNSVGGGSSTATPTRSAATPTSAGGVSSGGGGSGRPNSASSAKLPSLRLSASELVTQLQAESSPSPRMPTTPASGSRGRFRSPGTTPPGTGSRFLSSTYSPSSGGGGINGRDAGGSGATTPRSLSPQRKNGHSRTGSQNGGADDTADGGAVPRGTWAPGSKSGGGRGRQGSQTDGAAAAGARGTVEAALSPRRPLPSTLPSSPQGPPAPALGVTKSVSSSGSVGGGEGNGWAETMSGVKGELPSLLAPVELHGRDGEGATHHGPILCLAAFESRACAGSTDGTVSVYDLSLVSRAGVLTGHTGPVTTVSCGDDWLLSGSSDSTLRLWQNGGDTASSTTPPRRGFISLGWQAPPANAGAFRAKVLAGHQGPITAVSAHPRRVEGKPWLAVSGGEDSQIRMWDLRTRRCKVIFTGHSKAVTCLTALREDGSSLILSGAKDCTVRLWDINEASGCKALRKFSGHEGSVGSILKIGPFAAVSCSNDRTLRTWDHRVKGSVGVLRGHTGPVTCVQQMPANRSVLASGSADGTVMMWDVRATAKGPSYTLRGHTDRVTGLLASGGSVYSCSEDASMHEWDWDTGQLKSRFFGGRGTAVGAAARGASASASGAGRNGGISCLAGTGSAVLTAGWDKTVRMWPRSSPAPRSEEAAAAAAAAAVASALAAGGRRR